MAPALEPLVPLTRPLPPAGSLSARLGGLAASPQLARSPGRQHGGFVAASTAATSPSASASAAAAAAALPLALALALARRALCGGSAGRSRRRVAARWRGRLLAGAANAKAASRDRSPCCRAAKSSDEDDDADALTDLPSAPRSDNLRGIFDDARGTLDKVTFDQAIRLEGVDGVIEEGATTLEELEVLWGDASEPKDFNNFCVWYGDVLNLYDDFLWKDAVAPPETLFEEDRTDEEGKKREWTDEELLEDAPVINVAMDELARRQDAEKAEGQPTSLVPGPAPIVEGRSTDEIKELFQEVSGEDNMVALEDFMELDEVSNLIRSGELPEKEMLDMWSQLPQVGGKIDIFTFRTIINRIDDLFEDEADEAEEQLTNAAMVRSRDEIIRAIDTSLSALKQPCGFDGRDELDKDVIRIAAKLQDSWRSVTEDDFANFDTGLLLGDWELVFTTSDKLRRYRTVMNQDDCMMKNIEFVTLIQSFGKGDDSLGALEYDIEEVFRPVDDKTGKEISIRGAGTWRVATLQNVITGMDDLKLQMKIQSLEHDTMEGGLYGPNIDLLKGQMCRTFCYSFISYVDSELLVMRTGYQPNQFFFFRKMKGEAEGR